MMAHDDTTVAMLIALAMGLMKVLEKFAEWAMSKMKKDKGTNGHSAKLDPETAMALKEIHDIVQLKDSDGVPLVYWPRSQTETQKEMAETLRDISRAQDKTVDRLELVADRLGDIVKNTDK